MNALLRPTLVGLRAIVVFTVLLGLAYPVLIFVVGQVIAPKQAAGSVVMVHGRPAGSSLLGQQFTDPGQLWARPSAAGEGYDASASAGSNLGPHDEGLTADIEQRRVQVAEACGVSPEAVPADAVTASGSGLDPHISPEYAQLQVNRVAAARGTSPDQVRALIAEATDQPILGFLGEPTVNVVLVNVALAQQG